MKLNSRRTILTGLAFLSICAFWQMYDNVIPLILTKTFHMNETLSGAIMAADNILALFLLPFFGARSDKTNTKTAYREALLPLYEAGPRGTLTQALMELGAMVCVPNGAPKCESCPLQELCLANAHGTWEKYPVKEAKKAKREEEKTVFYLTCDGCLAVRKRESKGLLAGLWELPNVEGKLDAAQALLFAEKAGCEPSELLKSVERVHVFTHIIWRMRCYYIVCKEKSPEFVWASDARRKTDVALPTAFRMFVEEEI